MAVGAASRHARLIGAVALASSSIALLTGPAGPASAESADALAADRRAAASITTSLGTTCAIVTGGEVTCWGSDLSGKLGNGPASTTNVTAPDVPIALPGGRRTIEIAAGQEHTCALLDDRSVTCWGSDSDGQLGNGPGSFENEPPAPITLPGGIGAQAIATGDRHTCALLVDGEVSCWGRDDDGQVGNGASTGDVQSPSTPVALPPGRTATAITAGGSHTCALLDDGAVACWGRDADGQVGNGATSDDVTAPTLVSLSPGRTAVAISAGRAHTCALLDGDDVTCWGEDLYGQLGNGAATGDVTAPPAPIVLPGGAEAIAVSAGGYHTCALLASGDLSCWGLNNDGELGTGSSGGIVDAPPAAVMMPGGRDAIAVSAGSLYTCALDDDFGMACWGDDLVGQLGNGTRTGDVTSPPEPIAFAYAGAGALEVGPGTVCAIDAIGGLFCWGDDEFGQVGRGFGGDVVDVPTHIDTGPDRIVDVAIGAQHTCALTETGDVRCWGSDELGLLGNGPGQSDWNIPSPPVALPGGERATAIAAGEHHTCALLNSAEVSCWGSNASGQLGTISSGLVEHAPGPPISFPGAQGAVAITAGDDHTCALLANGAVTCWGSNASGQIGNGAKGTDQPTPSAPIDVPIAPVAQLAGGGSHQCAIDASGRVSCWGESQLGQTGVIFDFDVPEPSAAISLPSGARAKSVSLGRQHTCALLFGGGISCWGSDWEGQLGDGGPVEPRDIYQPPPPIDLPGDRLAVEVDAGGRNTCAVLVDGLVACWGSDDTGQLGNGAFTDPASSPQLTGLDLGDGASVEPQTAPIAPSAPRKVSLTAGDAELAVDWLAPSSDGGSPILGYTATAQPGGRTCTTNGAIGCTITGLANGTGYTVRVVARNAFGDSPASAAAAATPFADAVVPIGPARYWDSRDSPTFDGRFSDTGRLRGTTFERIRIAGRGDVPADATGVVGNLTVITPDAPGYGVIYPCTSKVPTASTVNYVPGDIAANNTVIPLDANGDVCVFTLGTADFALDVNGYVPTGSPLVGIEPRRYLETRVGEPTFDGASRGLGRVGAGEVVEVQIAGRGPVPSGAVTAVVNATIIEPAAGAFATLYPCGNRPTASNINYDAGSITPNGAVVRLSPTGTICIYTHADAHMILDVSGYVPPGFDSLTTVTPARFLESRRGEPSVDGLFQGIGRNGAGETIEVPIAGRSGVPIDATAAILNLAVIGPSADGFATLHPCGDRPFTSNLNYTTGTIRANNAITRLSADGTVCIYTRDETDLILDVAGWLR